MTNIPGYNYDSPINEMPTMDELLHTYIKEQYSVLYSEKGTVNEVAIIRTISGKKFALRISNKYLFYVKNPSIRSIVKINPSLLNDDSREDILYKLEQSRNNWISAAKNNLCPEIYYYGFYKRLDNNVNYLYSVMISEAYDMDLNSYYNNSNNAGYTSKMTGNLSDTDIYIAQQLIDLINKISSKMFLICFDIKPSNCVININTNEVKLIDWDGDWCHNYKLLLNKRGPDSQTKNIGLISLILMANHFYSWCRWNIFSYYFNDNMHLIYPDSNSDKIGATSPFILAEKYDALEHLFCELNEHYIFMSNFYFKINAADCQEIFKIMVDRIYDLSPPADYTINRGGKKIKNKRKINKRKTNKRRMNKRKTNKRKTKK
mgnify:CR=1 FL=1|tara:strand:+ start:1023 stop:2147 length:1125 start_codon:yes stop_codon:yes gene_type:complete